MPHHDLVIIGSGSGNSILGPEYSHLDVAFIEKGIDAGTDAENGVFGGTCLNVGCIPTKMFVYTADVAQTPSAAPRYGVRETLDGVDWPAIRDRIFGRIDPIGAAGEEYRSSHPDNDNVTVYRGSARFTGPGSLAVCDEADPDVPVVPIVAEADTLESDPTAGPGPTQDVVRSDGAERPGAGPQDATIAEITFDRIVIAAGSRPAMLDVPGLAEAHPYTSDTVMRLETLPRRLAIIGSGFIAVEFAHIFASLGVQVTVIARSDAVLRKEDEAISQRATELLGARDDVDLRCGFRTRRVETTAEGHVVHGDTADGPTQVIADEILVATGRVPNTDLLDAAAAGYDRHDDGRLVVDAHQRILIGGEASTDAFALGDISSPYQLKHVANREAKTVKHNLVHPDDLISTPHDVVPHAVFGHPQIGAVGLTTEQAREAGYEVRIAIQEYSSIAYGWAMEDTTGFAKIIAEKGTGRILGAHIIGPQAPTMIQQMIQAMSTGQTVQDIAETQYWIHPAMPELLENALLQLLGA